MNPTKNGAYRKNNNLLIFYSTLLAINHEAEFQELWNGHFGEGSKTATPLIYLNTNVIENYFCPEDDCANKIITALGRAEKSIYFMTFSFTHEGIADALLFNKHTDILGIVESRSSAGRAPNTPAPKPLA